MKAIHEKKMRIKGEISVLVHREAKLWILVHMMRRYLSVRGNILLLLVGFLISLRPCCVTPFTASMFSVRLKTRSVCPIKRMLRIFIKRIRTIVLGGDKKGTMPKLTFIDDVFDERTATDDQTSDSLGWFNLYMLPDTGSLGLSTTSFPITNTRFYVN